jgi:hypothetical protein
MRLSISRAFQLVGSGVLRLNRVIKKYGRDFRWSLQHFGEFVWSCHPSEGLSRSSVERVGGFVITSDDVLKTLKLHGCYGEASHGLGVHRFAS